MFCNIKKIPTFKTFWDLKSYKNNTKWYSQCTYLCKGFNITYSLTGSSNSKPTPSWKNSTQSLNQINILYMIIVKMFWVLTSWWNNNTEEDDNLPHEYNRWSNGHS
jgi:hypothetical protein